MNPIITLSHTLPTRVHNEDKIITRIAELEGFKINTASALSGGSINRVLLVDTSEGKRVLKLNSASSFPGMFQAEKEGLDELKTSGTVNVPEAFSVGETLGTAYLMMEYIKEGPQKPHFWNRFAEDLAALHKTTSPAFGFPSQNYIGSLPQYNEERLSAAEFYIEQRLEPQLKMAREKGFSFDNPEVFFTNISRVIPQEPASLIHGDLWSGNYLVNEQGLPCLIDPAVSYGPREMDLAMMKLFGGFPERVFSEYQSFFPLEPGFEDRVPIWQLYYLLVHLNIFGSSYLPSVKKILTRFS